MRRAVVVEGQAARGKDNAGRSSWDNSKRWDMSSAAAAGWLASRTIITYHGRRRRAESVRV